MPRSATTLLAPVSGLASAAFAALSAARRKRIFHPEGLGYRASLRVEVGLSDYEGVPLLAEPGSHDAIVRCSRGAGLPESLPDVLGLAVRLPDLHGPGAHQDFLLASSGDGLLLHLLLLPAPGGFFGQSYSSILPYRVGGALRLVGAVPVRPPTPAEGTDLEQLDEAASDHQARFHLALAGLGGRWQQFGTLSLLERLTGDETEALTFNPWNTGGGFRPTGPLMGLRDPAYRGSQWGRGARTGASGMPADDPPTEATTRTASRPS
ncbi:MAG TPA: hypothetical protein VKA88_01020 [Solirubrobacterales bacterium]|nr:hypothetical protein [Solirubrobacterales bacterium]